MSKSKFWAGDSDGSGSDESSPKKKVVAKNRFQMSDSESESESDSESDWDSDSSSGSSSSYNSSSSSGSSSSGSSDSSSKSGSDDSWDAASASSKSDAAETEAAKRERRSRRWLKDSDEESGAEAPVEQTKRVRRQGKVVDKSKANDEVAKKPEFVKSDMKIDELREKTAEAMKTRGRKGIDRPALLTKLELLLEIAGENFPATEQATLLSGVLAIQLDASVGSFTALSKPLWKECTLNLRKLLAIFQANPSAFIRSPDGPVDPEDMEEERRKVCVALALYAEILDEDLYKSLQLADPQQPDAYVAILADVPTSIATLVAVSNFLKATHAQTKLLVSKLALKVMEHLHYQTEASSAALTRRVLELEPSAFNGAVNDGLLMRSLAREAATLGGLKEKATAILLLCFFLASREGNVSLCKRLLMCDMAEYLSNSEIGTQIMYNRVIAAVGVAAFKAGDISEAHFFLSELCGNSKTRELLAQSTGRANVEKTAEQEKAEKRRQLPYHMHMNVEAVELAHFLSAMFLEVPNICARSGKIISRAYRKFVEYYDRAASGPPENYRETLALAGKAMVVGDIDRADDLIRNLDIWERLEDGENVKIRVLAQLKTFALKTYLIANLQMHEAYRVSQLGQMFGMDDEQVRVETVGWILSGDLEGAALDESRTNIVARKTRGNRLALIGSELTEKLQKLNELVIRETVVAE